MNILLTNDDGIASPGIWAAARQLAGLGQVTMVAPAQNHSGYATALPPACTLSFFPHQRSAGHPENVTAYGLWGTPATCAHVGLSGVLGGAPFDLVVSDINHGANLGRDVFYSGTVGAALTAHLLGYPAIAISLDAATAGVAHFDSAASALVEVVRLWQANPDPTPALFNVNAPNLPVSQLAGPLITTLAENCCLGRYRIGADPHEENVLRVTRDEGHGSTPELWTDAWAVGLGYVAITPLHVTPDLLYVAPRSAPAEAIALPTLMVRTAAPAEHSPVKSNPARASKTPSFSFKRIRWCQ